jgi:hypothetical protein
MVCTVLLGLGLSVGPHGVVAQSADRKGAVSTGPADAKEQVPQAKDGDPVEPQRRPALAGVLPPMHRKRPARKRRPPRSLETDPADLIPLPIDRDRFLWAASPRLRSGAWYAAYALVGRSVQFHQYEPEIVYEKKDTVLMTEVGGAVRLGRFELSLDLPLVGQLQADFYQKGVVDQRASKVELIDPFITAKVAFPFRQGRGKSVWLLTPYITLGLPIWKRGQYSANIGGRTVTHFTSGPKAVAALPGVAMGWRRGMFSAVVSVGILARVTIRDERTPDPEEGRTSASWIGAYQLSVAPFRDIVFSVGLTHLHQLLDRVAGDSEDVLLVTSGVRFQPWAGLFGHVGVSAPLGKASKARVAPVISLAVGWEFR